MQKTAYRPDIDGLRAVAVLGVFLYHLHAAAMPGGFVGVDVFFVISGYLITSIILRELDSGNFRLSTFYQRRVARLLPQIAVVTIFTYGASLFVYGREEIGAVGSAGAAASVSLANLKFMLQGNYFEFPEDIQPLLHFWSLSVEEQFYFIAPGILLLASGVNSKRIKSGTLALLTASLLASAYFSRTHPQFAFYMLPTRAWELAAGCLIAIYKSKQSVTPRDTLGMRYGQLAGLLIILASYALIDASFAFPGTVAIAPVLGAALVVGITPASTTIASRVLGASFMRQVGQHSFALYMWHWPVICFVNYHLFAWSEGSRIGAMIALTLACTLVSHRFLENPLRRKLAAAAGGTRFWALTFLVIFALTATGVALNKHYFNNVNTSSSEVVKGGVHFGTGERRVALIGDSKAGMYGGILAEMATEHDFTLNVLSVHSSNPLPGTPLWSNVMAFVRQSSPHTVVLSEAWGAKLRRNDPSVLREAIRQLLSASSRVIVVTEPPILPATCSRHHIAKNGMPEVVLEDREQEEQRQAATSFIKDELRTASVIVVDPADLFLGPGGSIQFLSSYGKWRFYDKTHLSYDGARLVRPRLQQALGY